MSKRESFLRYLLIIRKLQRGRATFKEISNHLDIESEIRECDLRISNRTFQRDLDEIRSLFNRDIRYDFSRKVYFMSEDMNNESNERMLDAFEMFNALNLTDGLSGYIHFEKRKSQGTHHIHGLLHCIKNFVIVKFPYHKFEDDIIINRQVEPYALKEFKGRWYLLARDVDDHYLKTFGLDRIQELDITKRKFEKSGEFDALRLFKDYFGIINTPGECEEIILSFDSLQGKYIKSFPLHGSQEILDDNKNEVRIKLMLIITYDFIMELLSYGDRLKIISPERLKKEVCDTYSNALEQYK